MPKIEVGLKPFVAGSIGVVALLACQALGGFEDYARNDGESSEDGGVDGQAGKSTAFGGISGTTSGGADANGAGRSSGGTASGGRPSGTDGGDAGSSPTGGAAGGTSGANSAGGTAGGGASTGGSSIGGSSSGGTGGTVPPIDGAGDGGGGIGGESGSGGDCSIVIEEHPDVVDEWVQECTPINYPTNPPCGGPNYGIAADFQTYTTPILDPYIVHALQHGGIALLYNCPAGCSDEVARAQTFMDNRPEDLACLEDPWRRRLLLSPDPDLPTRWAAVSWGVIMRASCFDEEAFVTFYDDHYDHATETWCHPEGFAPDACTPAPEGS